VSGVGLWRLSCGRFTVSGRFAVSGMASITCIKSRKHGKKFKQEEWVMNSDMEPILAFWTIVTGRIQNRYITFTAKNTFLIGWLKWMCMYTHTYCRTDGGS